MGDPVRPVLAYRSDVDGLRAVAVVSVLLYHLGVPPVSGGFVGVDLFFVISGYLITGIILSETAASRFSFVAFYGRRARRLLPALFATIALTFLVAAILFAPEDLRRTSAATVSALLGVSNISFWEESGYFDVTAILKPLLHTWSLAVELQFYLVWPAFLIILCRFGRWGVLAGVMVTIIVGTVASLEFLRLDPSAAFYLAPFRMHEFAIGALVVLVGSAHGPSQRWAEVLFVGGMAMILASFVLFDDLTVFPGHAVLLPAVGTALVLSAGATARSASFLRSRAMAYVGRISYSLYLVHWPLIVFTNYMVNHPLGPLQQCALIIVAFILAHFSYRYVERPFRRPRLDARKGNTLFYAGCAMAACAVLAPALHAERSGGWVWRFPADLQAINSIDMDAQEQYIWRNFTRLQSSVFSSSRRHILVVGDSQAADLVNMLVAAGFERKNEIMTRTVLWECGMPYMPEGEGQSFWETENSHTIKNPALIDVCKAQYRDLVSAVADNDVQYLIISYHWLENSIWRLNDAVKAISEHTKAKVILVGAKGFDQSSIQLVNGLGRLEGLEKLAADHISANTRSVNRFISANFSGQFVDLLAAICPRSDFCHVLTGEKRPIYLDSTHLTSDGAEYLGRNIVRSLFQFAN